MSDTKFEYREAELGVRLVGGRQHNVHPTDDRDAHETHMGVPVDGWVTFYLPEGGQAAHLYDFPFRDEGDGCDRWFAEPDEPPGSRLPVWKWTNKGHGLANITLRPSIAAGDDFHCYVSDGGADWL